jgi:hypothetical protein
MTSARLTLFALCIAVAATVCCRSQRLDRSVDQFVSETEKRSGSQVVIIEYPGNTVSKGNNSKSAIFAFLRPNASASEIAAAVMSGTLNKDGYASAGSAHGDQAERDFAFNLVGFVRSPKVDAQLNRAGFKLDYEVLYNSYLKGVESDSTAAAEYSKVFVAANAVGLALASREAPPELGGDIRRIASERVPAIFAVAQELGKEFPPDPGLTAEASYERLSQVIRFLDKATASYPGDLPSEYVSVINPSTNPPIDSTKEQAILRDAQEHKTKRLR